MRRDCSGGYDPIMDAVARGIGSAQFLLSTLWEQLDKFVAAVPAPDMLHVLGKMESNQNLSCVTKGLSSLTTVFYLRRFCREPR